MKLSKFLDGYGLEYEIDGKKYFEVFFKDGRYKGFIGEHYTPYEFKNVLDIYCADDIKDIIKNMTSTIEEVNDLKLKNISNKSEIDDLNDSISSMKDTIDKQTKEIESKDNELNDIVNETARIMNQTCKDGGDLNDRTENQTEEKRKDRVIRYIASVKNDLDKAADDIMRREQLKIAYAQFIKAKRDVNYQRLIQIVLLGLSVMIIIISFIVMMVRITRIRVPFDSPVY